MSPKTKMSKTTWRPVADGDLAEQIWQVLGEIAETLKAEKQTAMVEDWIEELIEEADIKIFDKDLRK